MTACRCTRVPPACPRAALCLAPLVAPAGIKGAVVGAGKGLLDLNYRPLKGLVLSAEGVLDNLAASRARGRQGGEDGEA